MRLEWNLRHLNKGNSIRGQIHFRSTRDVRNNAVIITSANDAYIRIYTCQLVIMITDDTFSCSIENGKLESLRILKFEIKRFVS